MSGKEISEHRVGLSGSGALSHVYIQHPPLRCDIPETQGLYYDDGNKLILSPTSDQVLSWKVNSFSQVDPPNSDSIDEGPILFIRYSLDRKVVAIQRSIHEIQFKNRETGNTFTQRCRPESESILGFFWTDCPTCDIVLIKTSGLDLLAYEPEFNRLRLVEAKRLNVSWYCYTHESRMVLLASGMQCKLFSGFQFSSAGIVRLPKFEMKMAKSEANQKPVLSSEDVNIVTIYGRIYCLQVDMVDMQLNMYRFYRDAVVHQGSLPVYSTRIAVSVVDNVLLVHQIDAKVVILYDVFLDSLAPISAPLPLLLKSTSRGSSSSQANARQVGDSDPNALTAYEGIIFGDSWRFLVPDLICDADHGLIWKIYLDLDAIAASSSEVPSVLEFLQRRKSEPIKVKQLCLAMMRTLILERRPISVIARALNILLVSYSKEIKMQSTGQRGANGVSSDNPLSGRGQNASVSKVVHGDIIGQGLKVEEPAPKHGQIEPIDLPSASTINRPPASSDSDSEGNANLEHRKITSEEPHTKSFSGDFHISGVRDGIANHTPGGNLGADTRQHPLHSEVTGPGENPLVSTATDIQSPLAVSVAISPDEMYYYVFSLVEEEMTGDPSYLVAVIVEFLMSAAQGKLKVHQDLYAMTVKLLARNDRYAELGMFVINKILEPSKCVALHLVESGHPKTKKLGMDMLRQLSLHHEYTQILLQDGYYLEALRYTRKYKVDINRPSLYLEAAFSSNNSEHLAAVLRFLSEYIPGFQNTPDHNRYYQVLNEIS